MNPLSGQLNPNKVVLDENYVNISHLEPVLEAGVKVLDVLVNKAGELEMLLSSLGWLLTLSL
jgi:hypothetical protein